MNSNHQQTPVNAFDHQKVLKAVLGDLKTKKNVFKVLDFSENKDSLSSNDFQEKLSDIKKMLSIGDSQDIYAMVKDIKTTKKTNNTQKQKELFEKINDDKLIETHELMSPETISAKKNQNTNESLNTENLNLEIFNFEYEFDKDSTLAESKNDLSSQKLAESFFDLVPGAAIDLEIFGIENLN